MSWERFRELFEEEHVAFRRPNTRTNYAVTFDWFEKTGGPKSLRSVNERAVSAFAAALGKAGMAPATVKVRLALLRHALRWAKGQRLIGEVPDFPAVKVPRKKPQPIPLESFERLLDKADPEMRAYLLCGWLAGLRMEEAARLEWEPTEEAPYFDPDRGRIVLPAAMVKAVEDQWVPLDPHLWDALQDLPRQGKRVFPLKTARGRPIDPTGISARVIRLAKRAGVRLTMRTLRRGFGCHYAGKVPAQVLQKLMRHASITTTMTYYANVDDAAMEAVRGAQRVNSRVSAPLGRAAPETPADANPYQEGDSGPLP
jgi:integrase